MSIYIFCNKRNINLNYVKFDRWHIVLRWEICCYPYLLQIPSRYMAKKRQTMGNFQTVAVESPEQVDNNKCVNKWVALVCDTHLAYWSTYARFIPWENKKKVADGKKQEWRGIGDDSNTKRKSQRTVDELIFKFSGSMTEMQFFIRQLMDIVAKNIFHGQDREHPVNLETGNDTYTW